MQQYAGRYRNQHHFHNVPEQRFRINRNHGASQQQENSRRQQRRQDSIYARNRYGKSRIAFGNIGHNIRASTAGAGP